MLLAAGMTAAVELELALSERATPLRALAVLPITAPLVTRLRFPLATLLVVVAATTLDAALGASRPAGPIVPVVAVLLALYGVGSRGTPLQVAAAAGVSFAGLFASSQLTGSDIGNGLAAGVLVPTAGLVVGRALGVLRFESDVFTARASRLERERDERARVAVADERRRIARELHDIIGHSISVMGVQAGAVRSVLREDQRRERDVLLAVERTGRQAVGEMRRLLGLLRPDVDAGGAPAPSLRRVEQLVDEVRDAGLAVTIRVQGDLSTLPPGIDLAGYRILQEALTNALKHAPGARVDACVRCGDGRLAIDVSDDGGVGRKLPEDHVGHGLLGMRERASLYGGEFVAGPDATGGFAVRARIPIEGR